MKGGTVVLGLLLALYVGLSAVQLGKRSEAPLKGILLEDLTWVEAEKVLTPDAIVVIPIGAQSKEHGPHLKLKNDFLLAEYFKTRLAREEHVVVAPTVNYHFYPAFADYPGSTSVSRATARDMMADIVRSLARYGPKRFYALNTGVSTAGPLAETKALLEKEGILFAFTDLKKVLAPIEKDIAKQEGGGHADEIETSMMLVIAPETVDMRKAVKDYDPNGKGLSRTKQEGMTYSPSGIWGDPTLATREKGVIVCDRLTAALVAEVEELRKTPVP